jgi:copper(I)-binding protein
MLARATASILSLLLVLSVAACGSAASNTTQPAGGIVTIGGAWVRAGQSGGTTAAYMTITNGTLSDDTLTAVATPVAASASLHETKTDASGMTGMQPVDGIKVPAGGTVTLEPGGYHVMLMGLTGDLAAGQTVRLTLTFKGAGAIEVSAEVRAS